MLFSRAKIIMSSFATIQDPYFVGRVGNSIKSWIFLRSFSKKEISRMSLTKKNPSLFEKSVQLHWTLKLLLTGSRLKISRISLAILQFLVFVRKVVNGSTSWFCEAMLKGKDYLEFTFYNTGSIFCGKVGQWY